MPTKIAPNDTNELKVEPADKHPVNADEIVLTETSAKDKLTEKAIPKEINGPKGLEPTRYGDWESKGRCYDF